jgi:UDP-glucose 4-epimerase
MGRRVLVTGLGTFWGGRVAQALEQDPGVDVIVGLDAVEPQVELHRTEYVRTDENYSILARIVQATEVDTILHTFLVVDSSAMGGRRLHEINVIGTMNLLAAAGAAGSTVRTVVVKSSTLVYGSTIEDPMLFREDHPRVGTPRTRVERSLLETEGYLRDFAEDNPHVAVSLLRFSNVLGTDIRTSISRALERPLVPVVFGYDPRFQFVQEDDVIRSILFVMDEQAAGIFNVAGDGLLPWSEVIAMCGRRQLPMLPMGTELSAWPLRKLGYDLTPELLNLLRYGRGVDNRRLKRAGFAYRYTSAGAVNSFREAMRLKETVGDPDSGYEYQRDVESFFRHSQAVVRDQ